MRTSGAAVLVTGASTGIGRATAEHLAAHGFTVWAGVRRDADGEPLRAAAPERIRPVLLDVCDEGSVREAAAAVEEGGARLAGLVNNAGIAVSGPLEIVPLQEWRRQLEVNVLGQVAVTRAVLPLLREARGRIVNMSSIGGRVALPFMSPYNASKFALEAISDSLRQELRHFGIAVAVVEPGSVATPIWDKGQASADALLDRADPERLAPYRAQLERVRELAGEAQARGVPPQLVAEAVAHALSAARPRTRYVVGRDAQLRAAVKRVLPDRAMDALIRRAMRLEG